MSATPLHARRAFSLAELVGVMILLSVLSAAAIPAFRTVERTREHALAREVQRRLCLARSWAASTGAPAGVALDPGAGTITLMRIAQPGDPPTIIPTSTGDTGAPWRIAADFPSAAILSVEHGDGSSGAGTIWFDAEGKPHLRDEDGDYIDDFTQDALVTVSGPADITVRRLTGLIER